MNLKQKLKFIDSITHTTHAIAVKPAGVGIEQFMEGEFIDTPYGDCFTATKKYDANYIHGISSIRKVDHITPQVLASVGKDEKLLQMELNKTVFLDTETTGLSSGVGTYIFLIGFGFFENDAYAIKQFFLRDFNEEMAFLYAVNQFLKNFTGIISYNGKSFDLPLLQNRFIYSRINTEPLNLLHLDLVHTARRIWRQRLSDCSLENIEQHVLNFYRENDVSGYLIPSIYFQYLRGRNAEPLVQVFRHNRLDLLSLSALLVQSSYIFLSPAEQLQHHQDLLSLAHAFENIRQWQSSINIYRNLLVDGIDDRQLENQIALQLSYCYKRLRMWEEAEALWQRIIDDGLFRIEPYFELAKYYEHHRRDYERAAEIVNRALQNLEIAEQLRGNSDFTFFKDDLKYRLNRILVKQKRREENNSLTS